MKKSIVLAGMLLGNSLFAVDYSTINYTKSKANMTYVKSSGKSIDASYDANYITYKKHTDNYIGSFSYLYADDQTLYTTTVNSSTSVTYDSKREVKGYRLSYFANAYTIGNTSIGPHFSLSRVERTSYNLIQDGYIWTSTGNRKSTSTDRTDNDLSLSLSAINRYSENSFIYGTLSLIDDLLFKNEGDDERSNFALELGAEHHIGANITLNASYSTYITKRERNADFSETSDLSTLDIGIGYIF